MKKTILLSFCFASLFATAQNVKLDTGKKITGTSTSSINMDMGAMAGGEVKINSSTTFVVNVTGADESNYKAESTITKMKMSQEGGGQTASYDSEDKNDNSEMAQEAGKAVNKPSAILIDKNTGAVKDASPEKPKEEDSDNPFADLMGGAKSAGDIASAAFFIIPSGKKAGDKWTDSSASPIPGLTAKKDYELQSVKDGIATVLVKTVTKGSISKEVQGMQLDMTINGTADMTLTTDTKTGLVKKNVTTGSTEGSMDVMGQSINFTMTANATSVFE